MSLEIAEPWFSHIRSGRKTVEGRKDSPSHAHLAVGQQLIITNGSRALVRRIVAIRYYCSILEYLTIEGLNHTLPGVTSLEAGEAVYLGFWKQEDVGRYGIKAIELG
jgi:ASC-1-like (ASCH) protein